MSTGLLNGKAKWLGGATLVLSVSVLVGGWVWTTATSKTATAKQIDAITETVDSHEKGLRKIVDDHEARLRKIEDAVSRTDENIQWIRQRLERTP